jgi:hypothetical protein
LTTYSSPNVTQLAVSAPGSSALYWLGTYGHVTALNYGYVYPGGCDSLTCTLEVPASYRNQVLNVGWTVRGFRGGHQVWDGIMDEPTATSSGWNITATGTGNLGQNYVAMYTGTWPAGQPDDAVNEAIGRGLPWVNPGIGQPGGMWLGQAVDPGAQTITALLNLLCTRGGLGWYVNSQPGGYIGDDLSVASLPSSVNRIIVSNTPVSRTLGGYINRIFAKYQVTAASSSSGGTTTATYDVVNVENQESIALHGPLETYIDLTSAGTIGLSAIEAVLNYVLGIYQGAAFAGPFTGSPGMLLNAAGQPIDPGTDQAGTMVRLVVTDFGYGGQVTPDEPLTFIVGAYSWDDMNQVFSATPYQSLDQSLTGLLSMETTVLTPITASS